MDQWKRLGSVEEAGGSMVEAGGSVVEAGGSVVAAWISGRGWLRPNEESGRSSNQEPESFLLESSMINLICRVVQKMQSQLS